MVTGLNGAGKTSLLRLLAGLGQVEHGSIDFAGTVTYLGHEPALKPGMTVKQELAFWRALSSKAVKYVQNDELDVFSLNTFRHLPCRLLSSGQKRRVALARVVESGTDLWLLDEPTVGLDAGAISALTQVISCHQAAGGMAVIATHVSIKLPIQTSLNLA